MSESAPGYSPEQFDAVHRARILYETTALEQRQAGKHGLWPDQYNRLEKLFLEDALADERRYQLLVDKLLLLTQDYLLHTNSAYPAKSEGAHADFEHQSMLIELVTAWQRDPVTGAKKIQEWLDQKDQFWTQIRNPWLISVAYLTRDYRKAPDGVSTQISTIQNLLQYVLKVEIKHIKSRARTTFYDKESRESIDRGSAHRFAELRAYVLGVIDADLLRMRQDLAWLISPEVSAAQWQDRFFQRQLEEAQILYDDR